MIHRTGCCLPGVGRSSFVAYSPSRSETLIALSKRFTAMSSTVSRSTRPARWWTRKSSLRHPRLAWRSRRCRWATSHDGTASRQAAKLRLSWKPFGSWSKCDVWCTRSRPTNQDFSKGNPPAWRRSIPLRRRGETNDGFARKLAIARQSAWEHAKRSLAVIQTTATFRPVTQSAKILQCACRCDALRDWRTNSQRNLKTTRTLWRDILCITTSAGFTRPCWMSGLPTLLCSIVFVMGLVGLVLAWVTRFWFQTVPLPVDLILHGPAF